MLNEKEVQSIRAFWLRLCFIYEVTKHSQTLSKTIKKKKQFWDHHHLKHTA